MTTQTITLPSSQHIMKYFRVVNAFNPCGVPMKISQNKQCTYIEKTNLMKFIPFSDFWVCHVFCSLMQDHFTRLFICLKCTSWPNCMFLRDKQWRIIYNHYHRIFLTTKCNGYLDIKMRKKSDTHTHDWETETSHYLESQQWSVFCLLHSRCASIFMRYLFTWLACVYLPKMRPSL